MEESLVTLRRALEEVMRETAPGDTNLIASMVHSRQEGELTPDEIFHILKTFFSAAHENLIYALPTAIYELLRNREQLDLVRADPSTADAVYEEAVRWEPHLQANRRRVVDDCVFHGASLRKNDSILVFKAAANRDPAAWTNPNIFDFRRDQNEPPGGSVSFGQGIHFCAGAGVARLVGPASINTLLRRFPGMSLLPDWKPIFENIPGFRKLSSLELVLE